MKQTLLTLCLIVFALPSWSKVGDVYFCEIVSADILFYDSLERLRSVYEEKGQNKSVIGLKFKFSHKKDKIEFGSNSHTSLKSLFGDYWYIDETHEDYSTCGIANELEIRSYHTRGKTREDEFQFLCVNELGFKSLRFYENKLIATFSEFFFMKHIAECDKF